MSSHESVEPNHRILVIDDNPAIHDDLRKILLPEHAGDDLEEDEALLFDATSIPTTTFEIESAYQGQEGLALLERSMAEGRPYAMAFVDVRMPPGWDGIETITRLWEVCPDLQVVICTAYSDYSWRDIRRKLGHSDNLLILKKPFDSIEVVQLAYALTKKWLDNRQASLRMEDLDNMVALRTMELQKAEEAFRVMFQAGPVAIALADMDFRYLDVNQAFEEMVGLSRGRIVGKDPVELGMVSSAEALNDLGKELASFGGVDGREISYQHPARGPRTALLWLRSVTIRHAPHVLSFRLDITDRKKMEEELRRAQIGAEAAAKAKSEFLANMSHEIRTPLNGVLGLSALLEDEGVSEDTRATLKLIRTSGETLTKILDDVLDLSKIESGKMELEDTEFSLRECLEWAVDLFRRRAQEKHVELKLSVDERIPAKLLGDSTRIRQVAMNLISNATKFTEEGSVRVTAELVEGENGDGQGRFRIRVSDTGIGIPEEKAGRLFQSFSQVDSSTTRRYGGTGLGLVICARLVEMMSGRIGVTSQSGKGSEFSVDLPARPALQAESKTPARKTPEPAAATRAQAGRPIRVLVAEDNRVNQVVCGRFLKNLGCDVEMVNDGNAALAQLRQAQYDLVLMDVHMPGKDGLETARQVRALPRPYSSVPILAVTASAMQGDREACLAAGMNDFLTKPLNFEALRNAIQRWGVPDQASVIS